MQCIYTYMYVYVFKSIQCALSEKMKPVMVPVSNDFIKSEKYLIAKVCGRGGWCPKTSGTVWPL